MLKTIKFRGIDVPEEAEHASEAAAREYAASLSVGHHGWHHRVAVFDESGNEIASYNDGKDVSPSS